MQTLESATRELLEPIWNEGHPIKFSVDELISCLRQHNQNITGRTAKKLRDILINSQTAQDAAMALATRNPKPKFDLQW